MLGYDSLMNYYKTFFGLIQYHKWDANWLEQMMPWEKFIYIDMLKQHVKHEEELARDQAAARKAQNTINKGKK